MTDNTNLIASLRAISYTGKVRLNIWNNAADALEAQAKRIEELQVPRSMEALVQDRLRARIAELEVPLCIGKRTIGIMAEEGCWQSEDGRAVVAADELFRQDPYARIAELEAENEELKKAISKPWMGSARAAYLGEK